MPLGGWKRGMLVSLHRRGEANCKEKHGILVSMELEHAVVSMDNLDSWVLDFLKRGGSTGEDLMITKRAEDVIYDRDIAQLRKLLDDPHPNLSSETPLGFVVSALLGLPEEVKVKGPLAKPPTPVTVYSELVKSDSSKMAMLEQAAARPPVLVVHGPPGTGKTTALAAAVLHAVSKGERVLVVAPSHAACDAVTLAIASQWPGKSAGLLIRLGNRLRLTTKDVEQFLPEEVEKEEEHTNCGKPFNSSYDQRLARLRDELLEGGRGIQELQEEEADIVAKATRDSMMMEDEAVCKGSVVVCTLATASRRWLLHQVKYGQFPLVCVDEAGFTLDPPLLPILAAAQRLILAGDHLQLPPVVLSKEGRERGLGTSLLERLAVARPASVALLSTQYRSHPRISGWSSAYFYKGKLEAAPQLQNRLLGGLVRKLNDGFWGKTPLVFIDTEGQGEGETGGAGGQSISNLGEALVALEVVEDLLAGGVSEEMVGMISPYWAQAGLLRSLVWEGAGFLGVEVGTVDGYQGREKEVVVVSLVRSNPQGSVGFLEESRRLNVAVTRARRCAIIIGDAASLATDPAIASLIGFCQENNCLKRLSEVFQL